MKYGIRDVLLREPMNNMFAAAKRIGEVVSIHIIPRPHQDVDKVISGRMVRSGSGQVSKKSAPASKPKPESSSSSSSGSN